MSKLTYTDVWNTLSKINCNEHKQEKNGLSYLSWSWAWKVLMDNYPEARYEFTLQEKADGTMSDVLEYSDGTCQVECTIRIGDLHRTMWLPVMDYRNKAITNPSARAISDTKMRCMVKCIGIFGLGLYIYAGEDLPDSEKDKLDEKKETPPKKDAKRQKLIDYIMTNKENAVFSEPDASASIQRFLDKLDDSTHIDAITNFKKRMESAIKNHKKGKK